MTNPAIRGSRVGAGPAGERGKIALAEKVEITFYCSNQHQFSRQFAATVSPDEIPEVLDCANCGMPAGQDKDNPPQVGKHEPYKTHLAYVKERRSEQEAEQLLEEALEAVHSRRKRAAESK
jgi:hypothetical protein